VPPNHFLSHVTAGQSLSPPAPHAQVLRVLINFATTHDFCAEPWMHCAQPSSVRATAAMVNLLLAHPVAL
jgi:hypothetical protein